MVAPVQVANSLQKALDRLWGGLPNLLGFVIIFVIVAAAGGAAAKLMGDTPTGTVVATTVPAAEMAIAVSMVLNQLRIAPEIAQITYIAPLGSVALGTALASGLGGRDVAARLLSQAHDKGRENKDQVKQDMQVGKARAQRQPEKAEHKADDNPRSSGSYRTR